jgi:hypothetical protein
MTDRVLFIGWGTPVRGAEERAIDIRHTEGYTNEGFAGQTERYQQAIAQLPHRA